MTDLEKIQAYVLANATLNTITTPRLRVSHGILRINGMVIQSQRQTDEAALAELVSKVVDNETLKTLILTP